MFFKKKKNLFFLLFLLILSPFILLSFDFELRRSLFTRILVLHDFYRIKKITIELQNRNFYGMSKELQNYINFSKIIGKGKNYMFAGIYDAVKLAASRAIEQDDYNKLENIFKQLIEIDSRVYKPHIWYARALSDSDVDMALNHLNIAIKISPSNSEAYREIIRIGQSLKDDKITSKYCKIYKKTLSGGSGAKDYPALFNNFTNDKFAIKLFSQNDNKSTNYLTGTLLLNEKNIYEFLLSEQLPDIEGVNLYFSLAEALKIKIIKIYFFDDDKKYEINHKELTITTQHSYIEDGEEETSIILTPKKDEIVRIKHRNLKKIKKIQIKMNIQKMNLTNKSLCEK
jgi:hypothetical protein